MSHVEQFPILWLPLSMVRDLKRKDESQIDVRRL